MTGFLHPEYAKHDCSLLKGAILPPREVEDFEIHHIERRFFNGENAIQMAADVLKIVIEKNTVYKTYAKQKLAAKEEPSVLGKRLNEDPEEIEDEFEEKAKPQVMMYTGINSYA